MITLSVVSVIRKCEVIESKIDLTLDTSVKNRLSGFRFAWAVYRDVQVKESSAELEKTLREEQKHIKEKFVLESLSQTPGLQESRRAFKMLGLDPARYRPSQEALLRRILKDQPILVINTGVDLCNLLSIRYQVPMGIYDLNRITGNLILKVGTQEEIYAALNERDVSCEQKFILCDQVGAIGSPYVDSKRTAVDVSCRNILHVVYFCHPSLDEQTFETMRDSFAQHLGGDSEGYRTILT